MYYCVYTNDAGCAVLFGSSNSLEEASKLRKVSGDLIVDDQGIVVKDESWLFEWEKKDFTAYSRRLLGKKIRLDYFSAPLSSETLEKWERKFSQQNENEYVCERDIEGPFLRLKRKKTLLLGRVEGGL